MLESKVYDEEQHCENDRSDQHQDGGTLEFRPGRPRGLLDELHVRLFNVVN